MRTRAELREWREMSLPVLAAFVVDYDDGTSDVLSVLRGLATDEAVAASARLLLEMRGWVLESRRDADDGPRWAFVRKGAV